MTGANSVVPKRTRGVTEEAALDLVLVAKSVSASRGVDQSAADAPLAFILLLGTCWQTGRFAATTSHCFCPLSLPIQHSLFEIREILFYAIPLPIRHDESTERARFAALTPSRAPGAGPRRPTTRPRLNHFLPHCRFS